MSTLLDRLRAAGLIPGQAPVRVPYTVTDRCPACGSEAREGSGDASRRN